ncbi:MAG: hypothetical protein Q7P63_05170 [Verrucomicrobiota bacterium JB022]|nr:hypothetical protein [Verrucomicrobiota bacterium JB022]
MQVSACHFRRLLPGRDRRRLVTLASMLVAPGLFAGEAGPRYQREAEDTGPDIRFMGPAVSMPAEQITGSKRREGNFWLWGNHPYLQVVEPVGMRFEPYTPPADRTDLLTPPEWVDHEAIALKKHQEREAAKAEALAALEAETGVSVDPMVAAPVSSQPPGSPILPLDGITISSAGGGSTAAAAPQTVEPGVDTLDVSNEYLILFEKQLREGEAKVPFRLPGEAGSGVDTPRLVPPGRSEGSARYRVIP